MQKIRVIGRLVTGEMTEWLREFKKYESNATKGLRDE